MHTPGPWTFVESDDARIPDRIIGPNDAPVARGSIGTNRADAVLIAAAPDLLDALQAVAGDLLDVLSQRMDPKLAEQLPSLEMARAVIAKATREI